MTDATCRTFLFSYEFRGKKYSFEIPANSAAEAQARLNCMADADLDGEVKMALPITKRLGFFRRDRAQ